MGYSLAILFCMGVGIWEIVFLPSYVEGKIRVELNTKGREVVRIQLISRRECVFLVDYQSGKQVVRGNVKYSFLGKINWL